MSTRTSELLRLLWAKTAGKSPKGTNVKFFTPVRGCRISPSSWRVDPSQLGLTGPQLQKLVMWASDPTVGILEHRNPGQPTGPYQWRISNIDDTLTGHLLEWEPVRQSQGGEKRWKALCRLLTGRSVTPGSLGQVKEHLQSIGFNGIPEILLAAQSFPGLKRGGSNYHWTPAFLRRTFQDEIDVLRAWSQQMRDIMAEKILRDGDTLFGASDVLKMAVRKLLPDLPIPMPLASRHQEGRRFQIESTIFVLRLVCSMKIGILHQHATLSPLLRWRIPPTKDSGERRILHRGEAPAPVRKQSRDAQRVAAPPPAPPKAARFQTVVRIIPFDYRPNPKILRAIDALDMVDLHLLKVLGLHCDGDNRVRKASLGFGESDHELFDAALERLGEFGFVTRVSSQRTSAARTVWQLQRFQYNDLLLTLSYLDRPSQLPPETIPFRGQRARWARDEIRVLELMHAEVDKQRAGMSERVRQAEKRGEKVAIERKRLMALLELDSEPADTAFQENEQIPVIPPDSSAPKSRSVLVMRILQFMESVRRESGHAGEESFLPPDILQQTPRSPFFRNLRMLLLLTLADADYLPEDMTTLLGLKEGTVRTQLRLAQKSLAQDKAFATLHANLKKYLGSFTS